MDRYIVGDEVEDDRYLCALRVEPGINGGILLGGTVDHFGGRFQRFQVLCGGKTLKGTRLGIASLMMVMASVVGMVAAGSAAVAV